MSFKTRVLAVLGEMLDQSRKDQIDLVNKEGPQANLAVLEEREIVLCQVITSVQNMPVRNKP